MYNMAVRVDGRYFTVTIDQLQYFLALAQCKNFTMAADHLYISQPALSKSIAGLERELHVRLISRSTHSFSLTPAGEEFVKTCTQMLETLRDGMNKAASAQGTISGRVIAGISSEYVDDTVVDLIRKIQATYPLIQITLRFFPPNGLLRAIDNKSIDIIFSSDMPRDAQLRSHVMSCYRNCILLPNTHPLSGRKELCFRDIKDEGIIIIDNMLSGLEYDTAIEAARREGCSPHVVYTARSIPELVTQVACGRGVAILSNRYVGLSGSRIAFVPLCGGGTLKLFIIWRDIMNPCIEAVVRAAEALCRNSSIDEPN